MRTIPGGRGGKRLTQSTLFADNIHDISNWSILGAIGALPLLRMVDVLAAVVAGCPWENGVGPELEAESRRSPCQYLVTSFFISFAS